MNDFTKDELKEIAIALNVFGIGNCGSVLYSKIQSMIDNYCEHDYTVSFDWKCKHCGEIK